MSILKKPYEISVWEDKLEGGSFVEKKICVIGTDIMEAQCRALEPTLIRNVNGTKKFSFKMYHKYVDIMTGEETINPFTDYLISERKVKLQYDGTWYDFIIKDINQNSVTHLYTYQLEDAIVQELSKNGFGVVLDAKVIDDNGMSNIGTAKELAAKVLDGTGWTVDSDILTQTVEEALVYVLIPNGAEATQLVETADGEFEEREAEFNNENGTEALAFYSCCNNKPYRFQFIYLPNGYAKGNVTLEENRVIKNDQCQYFIDNPIYEKSDDYYLPTGWQVINKGEQGMSDEHDTTVSTWYRGARYGFAHQAQYIPLLDRYCNKFTKGGVNYFGYLDNKYESPVLIQNVIVNTEFKNTSGWVGGYIDNSGSTSSGNKKKQFGVKIETAYGYFKDGKFVSTVDELQSGEYDLEKDYKPYLKVEVPTGETNYVPCLINSCFYDNRTLIGFIQENERWNFKETISTETGETATWSSDKYVLKEVNYNTNTGAYNSTLENTIYGNLDEDKSYFTIGASCNEETFKNKKIKLVITPPAGTYYIESMELYRAIKGGDGDWMEPGDLNSEGVITRTYHLFPASELKKEGATKETLNIEKIDESKIWTNFTPVFNNNAEKVTSVTAKESNYFNILQSIAEKFEAWLILEIGRDDYGSVESKQVHFKQYAGNENYASFRYGVNLKDIQRVYGSKNIVSKLIVKQNSNEYGENGFCTIARAGSNPTGETYIYDFRYYHDTGLLDARDYIDEVYDMTGAEGKDRDETHARYNLQGYFPRVKAINNKIIPINEEIIGLSTDLNTLNADKAVEENMLKAANEGIVEVREDFFTLTGLEIDAINTNDYTNIEVDAISIIDDNEKPLNSADWATGAECDATQLSKDNYTFEVRLKPENLTETKDFTYSPYWCDNYDPDSTEEVYRDSYGFIEWNKSEGILTLNKSNSDIYPNIGYEEYLGFKIDYNFKEGKTYILDFKITDTNGELKNIGGHNVSFENKKIIIYDENDNLISINRDVNVVPLESTLGNVYKVRYIGTYTKVQSDIDSGTNTWFIQPNRGTFDSVTCKITNIVLYETKSGFTKEKTFYLNATFACDSAVNDTPDSGDSNNTITRITKKIACPILPYEFVGTVNYSLALVDTNNSKVKELLQQFATYQSQIKLANNKLNGYMNESNKPVVGLIEATTTKENAIRNKQKERDELLDQKKALNDLFYQKYYRFIQEGTWIGEEYTDDDKYYNDALSVMYNSCYPQVAYTINVLELSALPGYELFKFGLGDRTYAEDPDFFGDEGRAKVIISENSENLDDPTKNTIKVQTFKNQFQDLFQKITATVQQTQYSTGAYEKAVALAEANVQKKGEFLNEAIGSTNAKLSAAGQTTVIQDVNGLTLTDSKTKDQMRLIGGAILMGVQDKDSGERVWKTGLTPKGISASLVTAGTLNAGNIAIMNVNDPVFRWDAFGLSAFDTDWYNGDIVSAPNKYKFVRFDKYGIYGINSSENSTAIDGLSWKPSSQDEIDDNATFALTWEGLKVTGSTGGTARLGKQDGYIMLVRDSDGEGTFGITEDGKIESTGIKIISGTIDGKPIASTSYVSDAVDNLQSQIDGEITTWFYEGAPTLENVPAKEWVDIDDTNGNTYEQDRHLGDLYYDTATQYAYRWSYNNSNKQYEWSQIADTGIIEALSAAQTAQETADGKATIFGPSTIQNFPTNYQFGDLLVPTKDLVKSTGENAVTYFKDKVYRCTKKGEHTSFDNSDWTEINYTDDTELNNFKVTWGQEKEALEQSIGGCIKTDDLSIVETIDETTGLQVTITKLGNEELSKTYTSPDGNYILTNVGVSGESEGEERYFQVSTEGLLQATNAVISGKLMANEGYIAGWDITRTNIEQSIKTGTLGATNSFHMYAKGGNDGANGTAAKPYLFGSTSSQTWMLGIGSNFGVTNDGVLYAKAGQIGKMTIEAVNGFDDRISDAQKTANDAQKTASEAVPLISNSAFSWKFSQTEGFYMYSGNNSSGSATEVFKIYKTGNNYSAWMKGSGEFTGKITSVRGEIGGWEISEYGLRSPTTLEGSFIVSEQIGKNNLPMWADTPKKLDDHIARLIIHNTYGPCYELYQDSTMGPPLVSYYRKIEQV